jgi:hypothetical protein
MQKGIFQSVRNKNEKDLVWLRLLFLTKLIIAIQITQIAQIKFSSKILRDILLTMSKTIDNRCRLFSAIFM